MRGGDGGGVSGGLVFKILEFVSCPASDTMERQFPCLKH